jgi:hypothetical protein
MSATIQANTSGAYLASLSNSLDSFTMGSGAEGTELEAAVEVSVLAVAGSAVDGGEAAEAAAARLARAAASIFSKQPR